MNGRQAAKAASKRIEELENFNRRSKATVKGLYECIDILLSGGNICERCEDFEECQLEAKGKGCADWLMKDMPIEGVTADDSKGVPVVGAEGGA